MVYDRTLYGRLSIKLTPISGIRLGCCCMVRYSSVLKIIFPKGNISQFITMNNLSMQLH